MSYGPKRREGSLREAHRPTVDHGVAGATCVECSDPGIRLGWIALALRCAQGSLAGARIDGYTGCGQRLTNASPHMPPFARHHGARRADTAALDREEMVFSVPASGSAPTRERRTGRDDVRLWGYPVLRKPPAIPFTARCSVFTTSSSAGSCRNRFSSSISMNESGSTYGLRRRIERCSTFS